MTGVLARARMRAVDWVWLDVVKSNTGARRFYRRQGFGLLAEIPLQTDLLDPRLLVMGLQLSGCEGKCSKKPIDLSGYLHPLWQGRDG